MRDLESQLEAAIELERVEHAEFLRVAEGLDQIDGEPSWGAHRARFGNSRPYVLPAWRAYLRQYQVWLEAVRARHELAGRLSEEIESLYSERFPPAAAVLDEVGRRV